MGVVVLEDCPGTRRTPADLRRSVQNSSAPIPALSRGNTVEPAPGRTQEKRLLHVAKKSSSSLMFRRTISRFRATIFPGWRSAVSAKNSPGALLQMVE
nr:hypothetical protein [Methanoculleus bourgensis]